MGTLIGFPAAEMNGAPFMALQRNGNRPTGLVPPLITL
jgi:hypothetical protein